MNSCILQSADFYERLMFKEALRTCFFEFQAARDKYRELTVKEKMRKDLIFKFIESQVLILSPICPHISEHVWSLLGKVNKIKVFLLIFICVFIGSVL